MKLVKMSLAAAVLLGASAFAIDNVKVSGDAKLFYGTDDHGTYSMLDKDSSYADTAVRVGVSGDLLKGVSFGLTGYGVSTLGLENNLVSGIWSGAHTITPANANTAFGNPHTVDSTGVQVNDAAWLGEAWLATTLGKTTAKIGRMTLDTPLAFTETWNIAPNTFEAAVLINQDIPDTTLVGAWVGKGNGGAGVVGSKGTFNTFVTDGAYAAAIVNNSFKPLVAQAWYYNVVNVADAYWLQADWDCQLIKGVKVGAQYADMSPKGWVGSATPDSKAWAAKLAFAGVENLNVSAAYSSVDNDGALKVQNVATDLQGAAQSKLYTETWWTYGEVGAPSADSWNLTAEYDAKNIAKLGAYYTHTKNSNNDYRMNELAVTATKSFGPLDATLAYINTDFSDTDSVNTLQAYLTLNF
ncbi:OprD family outer membrane porin [Sulfuricurvum sp.]|uniref:OprD family outer membrane porin n=1 Tax=Sulfuricurvum sp. TaxID=2025608 RepID=UPI002D70A7FB|nr:OprD family outer membrane porin [Sulfuricurvum sp.]HZF70802.1 OprD family outer membrane porin [Sulfuricurvum sp.]